MRIYTKTLTSGQNYVITADKTILQWSVIAATSTSTFTILGTSAGIGGASTVISFPAGTGGYNSEIASANEPWNDVTISCLEGSVLFVATQD